MEFLIESKNSVFLQILCSQAQYVGVKVTIYFTLKSQSGLSYHSEYKTNIYAYY
jgi:hypothetical protein